MGLTKRQQALFAEAESIAKLTNLDFQRVADTKIVCRMCGKPIRQDWPNWWNGKNSENPERNDVCRDRQSKGCRWISLP